MDFDPAGLAGTSEQVNFFQAALMIQNSAIIYGKKVEYLYKMVLEALNTSHGKRKRNKKGSTLPLTLDECFNSLPSDIFSGDQYIEVTSRQTIPLSLAVPSKVPLIPQIPPTLLPRECEQSLYSTFPELKDSNGAEIGKWEDFMLNSFTRELDAEFQKDTACTLPELNYTSEVEVMRDASAETEHALSNQMNESLTLEAEDFQKSGSYLDLEGGFEIPFNAYDPDLSAEHPEAMTEDVEEESWAFGCLDPHEEIPILEAPFKRGDFSQKLSRKASAQPLRIAKLEADFPLPKTSFKRTSCPAFYGLMLNEAKRRRAKLMELKEATTFDELAALDSVWDEPILKDDDFEPEFEAYSRMPTPQGNYEDSNPEEFLPYESTGLESPFDRSFGDIGNYFHKVHAIEKKVETKLSRNIKAWERQLAPRLEAQKAEKQFSISKYSASIIDWFEEVSTVPFKSKVASCERTDVPRLFLTMLHMVESGNLEIISGEKDFSVKLVSDILPSFEEQPTFKSPSFFM
ncbi:Condensin-2 complex subunit H2, variant 3 [Entomophthora muscae]|nr:Condensin-2 complex subunit H2, variant 3 [Entomophthora muscae]